MHKRQLSLDGIWQFLHSQNNRATGPIEIRKIKVPGPWQAQFDDLRTRGGKGAYQRDFELDSDWLDQHCFLRFGAVFHNARVFVNDTPVGTHEGGFLPFSFDVTQHLVAGRNDIKVSVESPTDDLEEFPDAPLTEIPFGKQSWYGPLSGIWQSVWLEKRIPDHIARIRIRSDLATGQVQVRLAFAVPLQALSNVEVKVFGPDGILRDESVHPVEAGQTEFQAVFQIAGVQAWSPDSPSLYHVEALVRRSGTELDDTRKSFGFRTFEVLAGRFLLNGQPLYLRGALDQDYYPDMICAIPSVDFIEDQFRKAKELGLNCLRCHIKTPDPRYYDAADRIGLLIWTELPNGGISTDRSRARKEATLKGIVDRDGDHPCIVIWTIINENWGVDLVHDAEHRDWLRKMYHWLKAYDPGRLVVDNSPLAPSFHVETDIADYHYYAAIPDNRGAWDHFVRDLASRPRWLFSPAGDAVTTGREPLVCSEFGNWGLPDPDQLRDENGREPWWFETGHDWGEGIMYAHGIENRFADWSVDRVFDNLRGFVEAAQWQQFRALKYQIEAMRREQPLAGYVITAFTDTHWESNGLLDMRRNQRTFHDVFSTFNADLVIIPAWQKLAYRTGDLATFDVSIANGGPRVEDSTLTIAFGAKQSKPVPAMDGGAVQRIGAISFPVPEVEESRMDRIAFMLTGPDGDVLAENSLDIAIYPRRAGAVSEVGPVWSSEAVLRDYLQALGYRIAAKSNAAALIIERKVRRAHIASIRDGGRMLLLPENEMSLDPLFPHWQSVKVRKRAGTPWKGDWASSFSWLRRSGKFRAIPGGPLIDETMDRVIPSYVISGCNLMDFQSRVSAGLVVAWIHRPVAISVERSYGRGRVLVSTFRLFRDPPGSDPVASTLLDVLIAQASGMKTAGIAGPLFKEVAEVEPRPLAVV